MEYDFRPLATWTRPKTKSIFRKSSRWFKAPYSDTLKLLDRELKNLLVKGKVVFEIDLEERHIRIDGRIRADAPQPSFPGIIVSFVGRYGPMRFCCDDFAAWQHNLRAIAMTMERLRGADMYGVTKSGEQYTGWRALPDPMVTPPPMTVDEAKQYISAESGLAAGGLRDRDSMNDAYRAAAKKLHPDATNGLRNGSWLKLQEAKAVLDRSYA